MRPSLLLGTFLLIGSCCSNRLATAAEIEFNRDIRPILSNHCFQCHGPDAEHREAGLRFDIESVAKSELESGLRAIIAGDPDNSELIARLHDEDEYVVMPPPETNKPLSDQQKQLLADWIAAGAPYEAHWSLVPLEKPAVPQPPSDARVANPIDAFVAARLAGTPLSQSPAADRRTLLRRLSFDLTGLPPTPEVLAAFEADDSPRAYENAVDRLLARPAYGEHMARFWLDLVRYADTHGMHFDNYREMWPYRDYVINAFNSNKPLDAFYVEQLAGDLMNNGNPSLEQQIASGFNRLNVTTNEGGSIYEEVFIRNVVDRTEAFGTVFLGLTTGCAVCHDHKFDPISQQEFYELSAFFNSLDGRAMDANRKDHAPVVRVPDEQSAKRIAAAKQRTAAASAVFTAPDDTLDAAMAKWVASFGETATEQSTEPPSWQPATITDTTGDQDTGLEVRTPADGQPFVEATGINGGKETYTVVATLPAGTYRGLKLTCLPDPETERVGREGNGNVVISEVEASVLPANGADRDPVAIRFSGATADYVQDSFSTASIIDGKIDANDGWALGGHQKKGGRELSLTVSEATPIQSAIPDEPVMLRFVIQQRSKYPRHNLSRFRLEVSEQPPMQSAPVEWGDWHVAGPFESGNVREGVRRQYAGEKGNFDPDATFNYRGQTIGWTARPDLTDGVVHDLPSLDDLSSAIVLHRTITSPIEQTITLLASNSDGYVVRLNKKEIAKSEDRRTIDPLGTAYQLPLKKGENSLFLKVSHSGLNGSAKFIAMQQSSDAKPTGRLAEIAAMSADQRSDDESAMLRRFYRRAVSTEGAAVVARSELKAARDAVAAAIKTVPTTLVWKELAEPRQAHVLIRGEYDQKGDPVERGTPEALPAFDESLPRDRHGLARWLIQPGHPLTARVAVNRFWQQVFGRGLVKTSEDFGGQGQPPSHPDLLDWLAADFATDWDVKRLMKQIVMSETYRQSSTISGEQIAADPTNELLARGPRYRLDAESLRDQALAVSGLLSDRVGGPSVKPPQPKGLWKAVAFVGSDTGNFTPSEGDDIYRRSVYIFWKRTATAPMMATFDAPPRESCTARRERTNTPLQALLLMNEELYVQAARALARSVIEGSPDDDQRLALAFERSSGRMPTAPEVAELRGLLTDVQTLLKAQPDAAKQLLGSDASETIDDTELAAWTIVANTLLNLDEVVTKN